MPSIDGLASGLDTTSLITQLMQLERQPQIRLQVAQDANNFAIAALKDLSSKFLAVKTTAGALTTSTGWQPARASSTDDAVAVATASPGAKPTSLTFTVTKLAAAGSVISTGDVGAMSDSVMAAGTTIDVTKGAQTRTIDVGDGTLSSVVDAINAEKMGVTATAVQYEPGRFKLQISSTTTGADTAVSVAPGLGALGTAVELNAASDATLRVDGTNPYTITRPTNTMSDVVTGVTLTVKSLGTATVSVASDPSAMTSAVRKMVDQVNGVLADIKTKTAYDTTTKQKSVLTGDGMVRGLQIRLLGAFSAGTTVDGVTYGAGEFGITVERDGTVKLDEAKLKAAYEADPALVESVLGGEAGLAGRLETLAGIATAPDQGVTDVGLITGAVKSRERQHTQLSDNIKRWDTRLELRHQALVRQFTSLETALAQAQSQGQWLTGQLAGLQANAPTSR